MRNNHARLMAKNAVLLCPLCHWTTPWDVGSKTDLTAQMKQHLRQEHDEDDWSSSGWKDTCGCAVCAK